MKRVRYVLAGVMLLVGVLTISYLQARFDRADIRKAVAAVQARFPGLVECHGEMSSRFWGQVRVDCEGKSWVVDVVKGEIAENGKQEMQN